MGRLSCGAQCTRFVLLIFNVIFILLGLTLLGFGIYVRVSRSLDLAFSEHINIKINGGNVLETVGLIMILVAVFTILLSMFGCLGATAKSRGFLYIYSLILGLLVVVELAAFIVTLAYRNSIRDSYHSSFRESFIEIYSNNHTDLEHIFEDIEREFKCCGVDNVTDYYTHNFTVPSTCYHNEDFRKSIYDQGCADAVIQWLWNQIPIIAGILGSILLIEIFGIISSIALGVAISHSSYRELYE